MSDIEEIQLNNYDVLKEIRDKEKSLIEYIVQSDDTVQGIAFRFNINAARILDINSISEDLIVKGMVFFFVIIKKIKLPATHNIANIVLSDTTQSERTEIYVGRNLMDEIM